MLIATGLGVQIGFQSFINIGVASGVLPNTGIPLPFISYGLSSLFSVAIGMGMVLNISQQEYRLMD
jgi:rod shape determining protein RodA